MPEIVYKGNTGEWGELYSFLKLLADGEFHSADRHFQILENEKFPVISVNRESNADAIEYIYDIEPHSNAIIIKNIEGLELVRIKQENFADNAMVILKNLKAGIKVMPELNDFLHSIKSPKMKQKAANKSDLSVKIYDPKIKKEQNLGFSVKSKIDGDATLFNSNAMSTCFAYEIIGFDKLDTGQKEYAYGLKNKTLVRWLKENNCSLTYKGTCDDSFANNLMMIDTSFDEIMAQAVLYSYYLKGGRTLEIVDLLEKNNPCSYPTAAPQRFYEHKMRQFLLASALGMTSKSTWQGKIDATGGFLVVREDGELLCYHVYNWNDLQDYLYESTYFDQPSTGRHKYGQIDPLKPNELLLNFQIRFK